MMKTNPRHHEQQLAWRSLMLVVLPALVVLPLLALSHHAPVRAAAQAPLFTLASEPPAPCLAEALAAAEPAPVPPSPQLEPMVLSPIPAWQEFNSPIRGIETPPLCDSDLTVTNLPEPPNRDKLPSGEAATSSNCKSSIVNCKLVAAPRPPYPSAMRKRRITGSVGVRISVSPQGLPTAVDIIRPSGHSEFDTTTRSWILRHWRFQPASTAAVFTTTVHFRLQ